ncbi:IS110 family transposase [Deferribacter thermophilus]|uniref:IS110 family transposase n=1 Tax=Deferribacter thermophilus TaxID=53573 RepID=UPI003C1708CC
MKNNFSFFVGIDISKDKFNYCIINESMETLKQGETSMDYDGFQSFNDIIHQFKNSVIALESTGSYHLNLLSFLISNNHTVALINPALIKKFAQTITLRKTKTDKIDANIIAKFIFKNLEHINYFVPTNMNDITALARVRENISQQIAKVKTQLKQHLSIVFPELLAQYNIFTDSILSILEEFPTPKHVLKAPKSKIIGFFNKLHSKGRRISLTPEKLIELAKNSIGLSTKNFAKIIKHDVQMLKFLQNQLDDITDDFIDNIKNNKKDDMEIISSIKGISDITSAHFMAEIKDIERFENHRKLSAYAGLDPAIKESGKMYSRGRISKKGSKSLRRYIYLMASGVIRCNEHFKRYYDKKRAEGMPHRKAMIALCNKLIRILFAMLKNREKFNPALHYL